MADYENWIHSTLQSEHQARSVKVVNWRLWKFSPWKKKKLLALRYSTVAMRANLCHKQPRFIKVALVLAAQIYNIQNVFACLSPFITSKYIFSFLRTFCLPSFPFCQYNAKWVRSSALWWWRTEQVGWPLQPTFHWKQAQGDDDTTTTHKVPAA